MVALPSPVTLAGESYSTDVLVCLVNEPGPLSDQRTPFPEESFAIIAVIAAVCPCPSVCVLPPLKLIVMFGGGGLDPPPQPVRIVRRHAIPAHPNWFLFRRLRMGFPALLGFDRCFLDVDSCASGKKPGPGACQASM
jgi:hypothetical protein